MKTIIIKICANNEAARNVNKIKEITSQYEPVNIVFEECLNRCSFCEDMPYVIIQNGIEFGDDMDELCTAIEETLQSYRS